MTNEVGDVDMLAAAGCAGRGGQNLGILLLRCGQEYDTQRRQLPKGDEALIRLRLPTLPKVAVALARLALLRSQRRRIKYGKAPMELATIERRVAEALDVWLDDRRCQGIQRRALPERTAEENRLGEWLLSLMDDKHSKAGMHIERMLG